MLNRGDFYLSSSSFEIWQFIKGNEVGNQFQHNISKITIAKDIGYEYHESKPICQSFTEITSHFFH